MPQEIFNTLGPPPGGAPNQLPPDPFQREACYLIVPGSWEKIPLERLRSLASSGKDRNGAQVFDDKTYVIELDGPGTFTYVPPAEEGGEGTLTFLPPKR